MDKRIAKGLKRMIGVQKRAMLMDMRPVVYVVKCDEYYKIGKSGPYPERRIETLKVGNPYGIETIAIYRNERAKDIEKELHKLFSEKKHKGEWFKLKEEDLKTIEMLCRE